MSSQATGWALHQSLAAATKVILWGYAEHAGPDGTNSWISVTSAAAYAGVSKATAIRHVQALVEGGFIRFGDQTNINDKVPANRRPVLYDLAMNDETRARWAAEYDPDNDPRRASKVGGSKGGQATTAKRQGLQNATPQTSAPTESGVATPPPSGVAESTIQGLHPCNPNQERKPTTEPTTAHDSVAQGLTLVFVDGKGDPPDRFEEFWKAYPRKVGKGAARKAWTAATKTVDPDVVIAALNAQRLTLSMQLRSDGDYRPHPASWLHAERWNDEVARPKRASSDGYWG